MEVCTFSFVPGADATRPANFLAIDLDKYKSVATA
jgi:hypothetical protein